MAQFLINSVDQHYIIPAYITQILTLGQFKYKYYFPPSTYMQLVQNINQKCSATLPYYSEASDFTIKQYQKTLASLNNLITESKAQAAKAENASKQLSNDLVWMLSHAADDLLELMEKKLEVDSTSVKERSKVKRVQRIYRHLRKQNMEHYLQKMVELSQCVVAKGKFYHQQYVIPRFVTLKATLLVSREMLMEVFAERITQLRMTCKESKDTVTMYWKGEFKEEKIMEKLKENFGEFKQFTINFYNKGLEIKVSKEDLTQNYQKVMKKLYEIMREANEKGVNQWTETKTRTTDLYHSVLNRIKEKEAQIRREMLAITVSPQASRVNSQVTASNVVETTQEQPEEESEGKKSEEEGEKETGSQNQE